MLAAALSAVLVATPALAGFKVCNRTPHPARVALGLYDGTTWSSQGWWTVPAKGCAVLLSGPLLARFYYLYATDDLQGTWDGRKAFCVATADAFRIKGRGACEAHGYDRRGFFQIDTGRAPDFTQTLSD